jgi:hypothetical protein
VGADATAEGGGHSGSNYVIRAIADDGVSVLGNWMQITRSTGAVSFPGSVTVTGGLTVGGSRVVVGAGEGFFSNLSITVSSNTTINVSADVVTMRDSAGIVKVFRGINGPGLSTSCSAAVRCMDTGGPGTSRWLQVWAVGQESGASDVVLTANAPPNPPSPLPTGYTYYARLGAVRVDGSSFLMRTRQLGKEGQYVVTPATNTAALPVQLAGTHGYVVTPTWASSAVLGGWVPVTTSEVTFVLSAPTADFQALAPNGSYGAYNSTSNQPPCVFQGAVGAQQCRLVLESSNVFYATNTTTPATTTVRILGWKDNL